MNNKNRKPELLAPAGDFVSALTAFDCGADAVYAGLQKFNARERAGNFSLEDMSKLITYAGANGKKVYVTLNTLIKESELAKFAELVSELARLKPDALIVQDLGVIYMIREFFPSLQIHASTQMGFHNSAGLAVAAELGIKRVILERQLTMEEIRKITGSSKTEVEIFVHGALCCSLSGNCLFSSWNGGWSGNRGKCKQPCRRSFQSAEKNFYPFSTRDLCMLELIPEIKKTGIASLKIEGRLRKQDYVKNVVSAYRKVLDASPSNEKKAIEEAEEFLALSYGRDYLRGFRDSKSFVSMIRHDVSGITGQLCGEVVAVSNRGFTARLSSKVHLGDKIRIQSDSGSDACAMTVTSLFVHSTPRKEALRGETCLVVSNRDVRRGDMIYKIGESIDEMESRIRRLPISKARYLNLDVSINCNGFSVNLPETPEFGVWNKSATFPPAEKHSIDKERIINEFKSSNSEYLKCDSVKVSIEGNPFIPLSVIKEIRRECWKWIEGKMADSQETGSEDDGLQRFVDFYGKLSPASIVSEEKVYLLKKTDSNLNETGIVAGRLFEAKTGIQEIVLPAFCQESGIAKFAEELRRAYESGIRRFRVTSLFQLNLLRGFKDITITASLPLPVANSLAACELRRLGFSKVQAWVELEKREIERLISRSPLPVEIFRYGRLPLMTTRAVVPVKGEICDFRKIKFFVERDERTGLSIFYPEEVLDIPEFPGQPEYFDYSNAEPEEGERSSFNFNFEYK